MGKRIESVSVLRSLFSFHREHEKKKKIAKLNDEYLFETNYV